MRIAVVGAGVSGLVCAHLLHREHELVLFEAGDKAGGHANTVRVETDTGVYGVQSALRVAREIGTPSAPRARMVSA